MKRFLSGCGLLMLFAVISLFAQVEVYAESTLNTVDFSVESIFESDVQNKYSHFLFELTAQSENCPMPDGSVKGSKKILMTNSDADGFGLITFNHTGEYRYQVHQVIGSESGVAYDNTVYAIIVQVSRQSGTLVASTWVLKDGTEMKQDGIRFYNTYSSASDPDYDPDKNPTDSNPGGDPSGSGDGPQTGDDSHVELYIILFIASVLALTALMFIQKSKIYTKKR